MTLSEHMVGLLHRGARTHGLRFDPTGLAPQFFRFYSPNRARACRIKVVDTRFPEEGERTGTVGVSTGWRPTFLLIHRSNDTGSSDVLTIHDRVVAAWDGRRYVPEPEQAPPLPDLSPTAAPTE